MRRQRLREVKSWPIEHASKLGNLTLMAMASTNVSVYSVTYDLNILNKYIHYIFIYFNRTIFFKMVLIWTD